MTPSLKNVEGCCWGMLIGNRKTWHSFEGAWAGSSQACHFPPSHPAGQELGWESQVISSWSPPLILRCSPRLAPGSLSPQGRVIQASTPLLLLHPLFAFCFFFSFFFLSPAMKDMPHHSFKQGWGMLNWVVPKGSPPLLCLYQPLFD